MPPADPLVVLQVEDSDEHAELVALALEEPGERGWFRVERVKRLDAALSRLEAGGVDVVLLDLMLPDADGMIAFATIRGRAPDVPVVVLSAMADDETAMAAVREGAQDYVVKTGALIDLVPRSLRYAVERQRSLAAVAREQAARAAAETDLRRERELRALDRLTARGGAATTARAFGVEPLSATVPLRFDELVARYASLLELALDQRAFKVDHEVPDALRALAGELGFLHAGPRDVVELHTVALRAAIADVPPRKAQAYVEEARVMVLELMGYLVAHYRA